MEIGKVLVLIFGGFLIGYSACYLVKVTKCDLAMNNQESLVTWGIIEK